MGLNLLSIRIIGAPASVFPKSPQHVAKQHLHTTMNIWHPLKGLPPATPTYYVATSLAACIIISLKNISLLKQIKIEFWKLKQND